MDDGLSSHPQAATLAAVSALAFATAMVMAPPVTTSHLQLEETTEVVPAGSEGR